MKKSSLAALAALLGYSIFGFSFLFSKIALDMTTPFVLLAVRFLLAFLVLTVILLVKKIKLDFKGKPVKKLLLLGLVQPILYYICENYGISMTSSSFSGVIIGLMPVVGLIVGRIMLKERCSAFQIVCAVASVIGVALTAAGGMGSFSVSGTALLLVATLASALFAAISRDISGDFSPFERTFVMFALGSVVFTAIALIQNRADLSALLAPLSSLPFWGSTLYLSVVSSVCAFLLLNFAMNHISVATASIFSNFTTVISVLAGLFIMGDQFTALQLVGVVVITLSVFGVSMGKKTSQDCVSG